MRSANVPNVHGGSGRRRRGPTSAARRVHRRAPAVPRMPRSRAQAPGRARHRNMPRPSHRVVTAGSPPARPPRWETFPHAPRSAGVPLHAIGGARWHKTIQRTERARSGGQRRPGVARRRWCQPSPPETHLPPPLTRTRMSRSANRCLPSRFRGSKTFHCRTAGFTVVRGHPLMWMIPLPRLQWATAGRKARASLGASARAPRPTGSPSAPPDAPAPSRGKPVKGVGDARLPAGRARARTGHSRLLPPEGLDGLDVRHGRESQCPAL